MHDAPRALDDFAPDPAATGELLAQTLGGIEAGAPLDEIFLALADDAENPRLRRAAIDMGERLRRGEDLATAFRAIETQAPLYLRRALAASTDDAQIVAVLEGLVQHETTRQRLRRQMKSVLLYPAIVFGLLLVILACASLFVVPQFEELFEDFEFEIPTSTRVMLGVAHGIPILLVVAVAIPTLYVLASLFPPGGRLVHWLRTGVPFLGRLWICSGQHEFASVLGSLTSRQVVLGEALRCTVASLRDQNLARATRIAADKCERGASLSRSLAESLHFDPTLAALVGWGEAHAALPQALDEAAVVFEQAIDLHASFVRRVLPPILFIFVVATIFIFVSGLMIPVIDLLNNLL
jgi:type II secretory pathway component PulF